MRSAIRLFMLYLDLAELDSVFARPLAVVDAAGGARALRPRATIWAMPAQPLDEAVRDLVAERSGQRPRGPDPAC